MNETLEGRVKLLNRAKTRRLVLTNVGCSTYRIAYDREADQRVIVCLCCGTVSYNPSDVVNKYCGFCCLFHEEWTHEP